MARFVGDSTDAATDAVVVYTVPDGATAVLGGVLVVNDGTLTELAPETTGGATTPGDTTFSVGVRRASGGAVEGAANWIASEEPIALGERPSPVGRGLVLVAGDEVVVGGGSAGLVFHWSVTEASS